MDTHQFPQEYSKLKTHYFLATKFIIDEFYRARRRDRFGYVKRWVLIIESNMKNQRGHLWSHRKSANEPFWIWELYGVRCKMCCRAGWGLNGRMPRYTVYPKWVKDRLLENIKDRTYCSILIWMVMKNLPKKFNSEHISRFFDIDKDDVEYKFDVMKREGLFVEREEEKYQGCYYLPDIPIERF